MPTTFKEGVCPLCKLVCTVNLSNSKIQERESLLKSGVSLIFQKLGTNFTWSPTTWATTCDPCYHLIGEIVDLDKLVKETEEKICQKVGWISKLIEGNDTGNGQEIRNTEETTTSFDDIVLAEFEIKPEPFDEDDHNFTSLLDDVPYDDDNLSLEAVPTIKRNRKRKLPFNPDITIKSSKRIKSRQLPPQEEPFSPPGVEIRIENISRRSTYNNGHTLQLPVISKPLKNRKHSKNSELHLILHDFVKLLPTKVKRRLGPLENCKFSVLQPLKQSAEIADNDDDDQDFVPDEFSSSNGSENDDHDDWGKDVKLPKPKLAGFKRRPGGKYRIHKVPEMDYANLTCLTVVERKTFFLHHEFKKDTEGFKCGFPLCAYTQNHDDNDEMMEHILEVHFKELENAKPALFEHMRCRQCDLCPSSVGVMTVADYRKHIKSTHPDTFDPDDPNFFLAECHTCPKRFSTVESLFTHNWKHYSPLQVQALVAQGFPDRTERRRNKNSKWYAKKTGKSPLQKTSSPKCSKKHDDKDEDFVLDEVSSSNANDDDDWEGDVKLRKPKLTGLIRRNRDKYRMYKIPEMDYTSLTGLTVVEGKTFFLHHEFKKYAEGFKCGFPLCSYTQNPDDNDEMMDHIREVHFKELEAAKPALFEHMRCRECVLCPSSVGGVMTVADYKKHMKSTHPDTFDSDDPNFFLAQCHSCAKRFTNVESLFTHNWKHYSPLQVKALVAQGFPDRTERRRKKNWKSYAKRTGKIAHQKTKLASISATSSGPKHGKKDESLIKRPEIDFASLPGLMIVRGGKFFLQYEFKLEGTRLRCGFPNCSHVDDDDDKMMDHVREVHFKEIEDSRPAFCGQAKRRQCAACPPETSRLRNVADHRKHVKSAHPEIYNGKDPDFFIASCPTCSKQFATRSNFYAHLWNHYSSLQVEALVSQGFPDPREHKREKYERRYGKTIGNPSYKKKVTKESDKPDEPDEPNKSRNQYKTPENDFASVSSLTLVNGKKYFLHHEFVPNSWGRLTCGFPNCEFANKSDDEADNRMMDHVKDTHFKTLNAQVLSTEAKKCRVCPHCPSLDPPPPLLSLTEYRKHIKSAHPSHFLPLTDPSLWLTSCPTCSAPFATLHSYFLHTWSHYSVAEVAALNAQGFHQPKSSTPGHFPCHLCDKVLRFKQGLTSHLETHVEKKDRPKFLCDICGVEMTTERAVNLHKFRHDPVNMIHKWKFCPICDKKCLTPAAVRYHMARCHASYDEREFICEKCGLKFPTKYDLKKHTVSHNPPEWRPFECYVAGCEEAYRYPKNLERHVRATHGNEFVRRPARVVKGEDRPVQGCKQMYPCDMCDKVFELKSRLTKHMKIGTHNQSRNSTSRRTTTKGDRRGGKRKKKRNRNSDTTTDEDDDDDDEDGVVVEEIVTSEDVEFPQDDDEQEYELEELNRTKIFLRF